MVYSVTLGDNWNLFTRLKEVGLFEKSALWELVTFDLGMLRSNGYLLWNLQEKLSLETGGFGVWVLGFFRKKSAFFADSYYGTEGVPGSSSEYEVRQGSFLPWEI